MLHTIQPPSPYSILHIPQTKVPALNQRAIRPSTYLLYLPPPRPSMTKTPTRANMRGAVKTAHASFNLIRLNPSNEILRTIRFAGVWCALRLLELADHDAGWWCGEKWM
ncbi:hypothetical protein M3J09_012811 [Ascochyta lentis]